MASIFSGKQRAKRIDPAYPVRRDWVRHRRWLWSIAAAACSMLYVVWCLAAGGKSQQQFSHGPVVQSHALIEHQCDACHEPFVPVRADAWAVDWSWGTAGSSNWGRVVEAKCQACHPTPEHHPHAGLAADHLSCTVCHREHHGREAVITRAGDHVCLECHAQLSDHVATHAERVQPALAEHIGRFDRDHPEFRSLVTDRGKLKRFSHQLHLSKGVRPDGADETKWPPLRWQDLQAATPERPESVAADQLVQLQCHNCHALAKDGPIGDLKPINFERHCRVCHQRDMPAEIAHGSSGAEIRQRFEQRFWQQQPDDLFVSEKPIPGQAETPELIALREALSAAVQDGRRQTFERCGHCHQMEDAAGEFLEVQKPVVPKDWFEHARFSHAAHQGVQCAECHKDVDHSTKSADVLIAGRAVCVNCHTSQPQLKPFGPARFDCAECHLYHTARKDAP